MNSKRQPPAQVRQTEAELDRLLKGEAQRYARALQLADCLPDRFSAGEEAFAELRELDQLLLEIAVDHGRVKALKEQWDASGEAPSSSLRNTMDRLREQLETLLDAVQRAEAAASSRRAQLMPQLTSEMRTHQMRTAYRNAVSGR